MKNFQTLLVIAVAVFVAAMFASVGGMVGKLFSRDLATPGHAADIEALLRNTASELNARLPMLVDAETRLDSSIGTNKTFRYNYTLLAHTSANLSARDLQSHLQQKLLNRFCASKEMALYITNGVVVTYAYSGNDGRPIGAITIHPSQCGNPNQRSQQSEVATQAESGKPSLTTIRQIIPNDQGVSIKVLGISEDGQMLVNVQNRSSRWIVTGIRVEIANTDQHAARLRNPNAPRAYSEEYSYELSLHPGLENQLRVPVQWDSRVGFVVLHTSASGFLSN
jgi:hypothetical protein